MPETCSPSRLFRLTVGSEAIDGHSRSRQRDDSHGQTERAPVSWTPNTSKTLLFVGRDMTELLKVLPGATTVSVGPDQ